MSKRVLSLFLTLVLSIMSVEAYGSSSLLKAISKKYREAKLVEMSVEKVLKSELMGKETKYSGKIYLSSGKFRWENTLPEKTLLVFDGSTIWSEQVPPKELGGAVQVGRGVVSKKTRSHILISSLLGADLESNFKITKQQTEGKIVKLQLKPNGDDLNIKSLDVVLNSTENTLNEVSYYDDIGNLTKLTFSKIQFLKKPNNNLFKYKPPKGAQVTDL